MQITMKSKPDQLNQKTRAQRMIREQLHMLHSLTSMLHPFLRKGLNPFKKGGPGGEDNAALVSCYSIAKPQIIQQQCTETIGLLSSCVSAQ